MYTSLILLTLLPFSFSHSGEHALGAHEHGAIKVGLAVEKKSIEINIDGPAESFLGFEYTPKTPKEKKILSDLQLKWSKNINLYFSFDKALKCKVLESSFNQVIDEKETKEAQALIKDVTKKSVGVHSDIEAKAKLSCISEVAGSLVLVALKQEFKNIKKLTVEVISNETRSVEITKAVQSFKL